MTSKRVAFLEPYAAQAQLAPDPSAGRGLQLHQAGLGGGVEHVSDPMDEGLDEVEEGLEDVEEEDDDDEQLFGPDIAMLIGDGGDGLADGGVGDTGMDEPVDMKTFRSPRDVLLGYQMAEEARKKNKGRAAKRKPKMARIWKPNNQYKLVRRGVPLLSDPDSMGDELHERNFFYFQHVPLDDGREVEFASNQHRPLWKGVFKVPHSCGITGEDEYWNPTQPNYKTIYGPHTNEDGSHDPGRAAKNQPEDNIVVTRDGMRLPYWVDEWQRHTDNDREHKAASRHKKEAQRKALLPAGPAIRPLEGAMAVWVNNPKFASTTLHADAFLKGSPANQLANRMGPAAIRSMKRAPPPPPPAPIPEAPAALVETPAQSVPVPPPPPPPEATAPQVSQPTSQAATQSQNVRIAIGEVINGYATIKSAPFPPDEQIPISPQQQPPNPAQGADIMQYVAELKRQTDAMREQMEAEKAKMQHLVTLQNEREQLESRQMLDYAQKGAIRAVHMVDELAVRINEKQPLIQPAEPPVPVNKVVPAGVTPVASVLGNALLMKRYKNKFLGDDNNTVVNDSQLDVEKVVNAFIEFLAKATSAQVSESQCRGVLVKAKYAFLGADENGDQLPTDADDALNKFLVYVASRASKLTQ